MWFEDGRFEALRERLLRAGIAPRRVRRYLDELDDHLAELTAREVAAGYNSEEAASRARALLGPDGELAESWLSDPRLKSFTARAPWLVFVLAPPFALLLAFMVPTLTLVGIAKAFGMIGPHHIPAPYWFQETTTTLIMANDLLLPALFAALLVRIALSQRLSAIWPLIAMIVIALMGMQLHVSFPTSGHDHGSVQLGMLPFAGRSPALYWQTLPAQWLFMLAPTLWLVMEQRRVARTKHI